MAAEEASIGSYPVTGVGTGAGPYSVSFSTESLDGVELDGASITGTASAGSAITPFHFAIPQEYPAPNPFSVASVVSASGASSSFSVPRGGSSPTISASGGAFSGL